MRVDPSFIEKVDEWRRAQPDLPNRSEAIRRIVENALIEADPSKRKTKLEYAFEIYDSALKERDHLLSVLVGLRDEPHFKAVLKRLETANRKLSEAEKKLNDLISPARKRAAESDAPALPYPGKAANPQG